MSFSDLVLIYCMEMTVLGRVAKNLLFNQTVRFLLQGLVDNFTFTGQVKVWYFIQYFFKRYLCSSMTQHLATFNKILFTKGSSLRTQGDHFFWKPGKPANVKELDSCQGNVRELIIYQGKVWEVSGENVPFPIGDLNPHLMHLSLDPLRSALQTRLQFVQHIGHATCDIDSNRPHPALYTLLQHSVIMWVFLICRWLSWYVTRSAGF